MCIDVPHQGDMLAHTPAPVPTTATDMSPMSHKPHRIQQRAVFFALTNGSACSLSTLFYHLFFRPVSPLIFRSFFHDFFLAHFLHCFQISQPHRCITVLETGHTSERSAPNFTLQTIQSTIKKKNGITP